MMRSGWWWRGCGGRSDSKRRTFRPERGARVRAGVLSVKARLRQLTLTSGLLVIRGLQVTSDSSSEIYCFGFALSGARSFPRLKVIVEKKKGENFPLFHTTC